MLSNLFTNWYLYVECIPISHRLMVKFKIDEPNLDGIFVSRGQQWVRGQCLDFEVFFEIVPGKRSTSKEITQWKSCIGHSLTITHLTDESQESNNNKMSVLTCHGIEFLTSGGNDKLSHVWKSSIQFWQAGRSRS